jgi:hypothetical protein
MPITRVHSFLVHPSKHEDEQPDIKGLAIPRRGPLYEMLSGVFERAPKECDIEVVFRPGDDGQQENDCRDLLRAYAHEPTVLHGRAIASRLQLASTHRSGLGLLFLMKGESEGHHQVVISRFPADQGIVAQEHANQLSVEFIDRVFMKNAKTYKSAFYSSDSLDRGFGMAGRLTGKVQACGNSPTTGFGNSLLPSFELPQRQAQNDSRWLFVTPFVLLSIWEFVTS